MRIILATLIISMWSLGSYAAEANRGRPLSPCDGSGGWGMGCAYNKIFVINNVTQLAGEVIAIESFVPQNKMIEGVLAKVKTAEGVTSVHLGPRWFLDNQDVQLKANDKIDVKGSSVMFDGNPIIVASEVIKDDQVLLLRDEHGRPLWSAWKFKDRL